MNRIAPGCILLFALACGGIDDGTRLDELTSEEITELCEEVADSTPEATDLQFCTAGAVLASTDAESCTANVEACTAGPVTRPMAVDCSTATPFTDCAATVGQYRACVSVGASETERLYNTTCEAAGTFQLNVPECEAVQAVCPTFGT